MKNSMTAKSVIFDFDGVIINSHDIQMKALKAAYEEAVGISEPPYDEFFMHSGDSLENIFKKLELPLIMVSTYREISRKSIHLVKLHEGMVELLERLNKAKIKCGLCTGKDRIRTIEMLGYLKIHTFFDYIVCSDDVVKPKPDIECLEKALQYLNSDFGSSVMVGDGINDILCAKGMNLPSIAVSWGDVCVEDLKRYNPDYIVNTVDELDMAIVKILKLSDVHSNSK